jgi:hypothetical protein
MPLLGFILVRDKSSVVRYQVCLRGLCIDGLERGMKTRGEVSRTTHYLREKYSEDSSKRLR